MRDAIAVSNGVGVFDIVAVVEIIGDAMAGVHAAQEDAGADVAEFRVRIARGAPVLSYTAEGIGRRVEFDQTIELAGGDCWELGFDPVLGVLRGCNVSRHKDGAFVRVIADDSPLV